jgi:hypothetical protein
VSYALTAQLLQDVLPIDEPLHAVTFRNHFYHVAERLEHALRDKQCSFIKACPRDWEKLPIPNGSLTVGIDGGYVRAKRRHGRSTAPPRPLLMLDRTHPDGVCWGKFGAAYKTEESQ